MNKTETLKDLFDKAYEIWEKRTCTISDIQKYNEYVGEIISQIPNDYAQAWAEYLKRNRNEEEIWANTWSEPKNQIAGNYE